LAISLSYITSWRQVADDAGEPQAVRVRVGLGRVSSSPCAALVTKKALIWRLYPKSQSKNVLNHSRFDPQKRH
jgi:hypothetical protein